MGASIQFGFPKAADILMPYRQKRSFAYLQCMARDLNKARDNSTGANGKRTTVTGTSGENNLAGELAADAYNIVAALGFLLLAYWVLFRNLPVKLFTLGLVTTALIALNVVVAVQVKSG
jgi:hypothetical protein